MFSRYPQVLDDLARCIAATTKFTQHEMRDDLISKAHSTSDSDLRMCLRETLTGASSEILTDFVDGAEREGLGVPRALLGCGLLCRYVDYDADATGFCMMES